jgi:hypothetical protein
VQIYSVDTSSFYNQSELKIHRKLNKVYRFKHKLKKLRQKKDIEQEAKEKIGLHITSMNKRNKRLKNDLCDMFGQNVEVRNLHEDAMAGKNVISVFDSVLTRTLKIDPNTLSTDIIVVQTYFFDILEDIILNGFEYKGERYVCFTASAGQIRTKKTVFIKEKVLDEHKNSLMCGLTPEAINAKGGVNTNKYLAYLALCNSATDVWKELDINRTIVVEDMETNVRNVVDFIDDNTYEVERKEMDIPITHTDGCGMVLPRVTKKSMMIRLPWIKGLLVPFPFDKFIREENKKVASAKFGKVTDIYGKEYDIIKDNIEVILTKSQFKMWKYYSSWDDYKEKYQEHKCHAGKCNEEDDKFSYAKLNYQMLQTLVDMTDGELKKVSERSINSIVNIGKDKDTMLRVLGVVESNNKKNYIQQALEVYPELLNDTYSKEILKQVKKSMVRDSRAGKIDTNGRYTFLIPDLYAYCEWLILGVKEPIGLLADGEVSCSLYNNEEKLDCLRSPHLYREHAIRMNVVDKDKRRWFVTKGIYTSCHDSISKLLMFDNDGDKALVCADKTIIEAAERNMQGIVPLFYNMAKAKDEIIDNNSIYNGLKTAYTGGNIGMISNNITKIWNSDNVNLEVVKLLCMENNFTIDYAKTLYKPERPSIKKRLITRYTKTKTPHFFIYAKDKKKDEVEEINPSVVNRLEKIIPNPRINFKAANLGTFDYKMLMHNKEIELDQAIVDAFVELDLRSHFMMNVSDDTNNISYVYREIKEKLLEVNNDINCVTDVLIEYLHMKTGVSFKTTLWECFGGVIVENLKHNMEEEFKEKHISCESCGKRIERIARNQKMCVTCGKEVDRVKARERMKNIRKNVRSMNSL